MLKAQLRSLWSYREFILGSVKREFQSRYRNSVLGSLWAILNSLAIIVIYTIIFSQLMKVRLPGISDTLAYSIYLCAGIMTWSFFAEIIGRCQTVFLDNANMIKKLNFPRICLPAIVVLSAGVNFLISYGLFFGFLLIMGKFPGWLLVALPAVLLIQVSLAIGLGVIAGIMNVFFRDVGQFIGIILQFWFWFTPIVYPLSVLPAPVQSVLRLNPMTTIVSAYQAIFVYSQWPDWPSLAAPAALSVAFCLLAVLLYRRRAGEMVDEM